jgi:hypothetical protein
MASIVQDPRTRAALLLMAQTWVRLADQKAPPDQDVDEDQTD